MDTHKRTPHYLWGRDNEQAASLVRSRRSLLKIILKTKNEGLLLERWLRHYLDIVPEGEPIIVLDHMSTDQDVWDIYGRYADRILLIRYDGHVDSAHSLAKFGDLYRAVWDSCAFYALLDTDEFLYFHDGARLVGGGGALYPLERHSGAGVFTPLVLHNVYRRDNAFYFEKGAAPSYLPPGKPLLNAALMRERLTMPVGHNFDLPVGLLEGARLGYVLFHMTHLSREQRIKANIQKLVNFGLLKAGVPIAAIMRFDLDGIPPSPVRVYLEELQRLMRIGDEEAETRQCLLKDHIEVGDNGALSFFPEGLEPAFARLVDPESSFFEAIGLDPATVRNKEARLSEVMDGA